VEVPWRGRGREESRYGTDGTERKRHGGRRRCVDFSLFFFFNT